MYKGTKVLDVHQHVVAPPQFGQYQRALWTLRTPGRPFKVSDEAMEDACQEHLRYSDERNIDCLFISPRPVGMMQWEALFLQEKWARATNDLLDHQHRLHPDRIFGVAQLPQNVKQDTSNCVPELERCFKELNGFVAAIVNPDPGSDNQYPGMNHEWWFPLYENAQALDVPLIVHPSFSRDPRIEIVPSNYQLNFLIHEYLATELLEHSDVFDRFPRLKIVVCHCGGALSRFTPWSGHVAQRDLSSNLLFDTCAYDTTFLEAAIKQKGVNRMLFGTEAPGSGRSIRPATGKTDDDLVPIIDGLDFLSTEDKVSIFNTNVKKVFTHFKEPAEVVSAVPAAPGSTMRWGSSE